MRCFGSLSGLVLRARFGSAPWVALLCAACATLPSAVPLADSSAGVLSVGPTRDRRPRSDAGEATVSVETRDSEPEVEADAEPEEEVTEEVTVVASTDAGTGCDGGAASWPGEYYGTDRLTTTFEEMPPHTMTDDKARTRVELGRGDRIVISIVDSSKGDVMCALNATVDGDTATLELGQTCFGQGDSAPDIMSGRARIECDRLTLDLTAATEIELEDDVHAGEMNYHFEGKRR
jgi:hypothetical protein